MSWQGNWHFDDQDDDNDGVEDGFDSCPSDDLVESSPNTDHDSDGC